MCCTLADRLYEVWKSKPILNDWVEAAGFIIALFALIFLIVSLIVERNNRKKDVRYLTEKIDILNQQNRSLAVVSIKSSEQVQILSQLLNVISDTSLKTDERVNAEREIAAAQRKVTIRPYFNVVKSSATLSKWDVVFRNDGYIALKVQTSNHSSDIINVEVQPQQRLPTGVALKVSGGIRGWAGQTQFRNIPISFDIVYEDEDGNKYKQRVVAATGVSDFFTISDPELTSE